MSAGWAIIAGAVLTAGAVLSAGPARRPVPPHSRSPVRERLGAGDPARTPAEPRSTPGTAAGGPVPTAVLADLLVALLDAGLPADHAVEVLTTQVDANGLRLPEGMAPIRQALTLAVRSGVAPGSMVRAAAAERRRREAAEHTLAARRLGVLVVLPVGLCLLPAFVLLTVVPLVLALV